MAGFTSGTHRHVTHRVIGAAIEVHKALGPGLLESIYEECLCYELKSQGIPFLRQVHIPILYKGVEIRSVGYRIDLVVENQIIVEVKAVDRMVQIHKAQMLTYLRQTGLRVGLLMNFNWPVLPDGIVRISL
jgi:GxxExxY protein